MTTVGGDNPVSDKTGTIAAGCLPFHYPPVGKWKVVMETQHKTSGLSSLQIIGIVILAMLFTMVATLWIAKLWLFPQPFEPVVLGPAEAQRLEHKLARLERSEFRLPVSADASPGAPLKPEPYHEDDASREILLSEREMNAMIARNTDLADKLAVSFSTNLISLNLLIPVDPDMPFLGGKTLRVKTGVEFGFRDERPVFILRGISAMGVPLPNAWIGGLKNIDLIQVFGTEPGFWKGVADGLAAVEVYEGHLRIQLKE